MRTDARNVLILVVDDDEDVRELVREILRTAGFDSLPARDGDQAIVVLETNPDVDLVITDVMMPGTDGPTLARRVAADHPGLPVIFMTGYPPETLKALGMLPPGEPPIPKPFPLQELVRKVTSALKRA